MRKINDNLFFIVQRGVSDNMFIRYFDLKYNAIINPKTNLSCGWLPIEIEHLKFLIAISKKVE